MLFWSEISALRVFFNFDNERMRPPKYPSAPPRGPDHPLMVAYKTSKKAFARVIKRIAKQYENEEICKAVRLSEIDRNSFWRLVKRCRNTSGSMNISIKRPDGVVVSNLSDVLEVWRCHFANLGTPKNKPNYDERHLREVTDFVKTYNNGITFDDDFLSQPFTSDEIRLALRTLNKGKAAGYDQISAEHIIYAGAGVEVILKALYNAIRLLEVIPVCFRTGIQIPLFKGKDLDILDPNNYRRITLLSSFNKVFEILIWHRLKGWWNDENVISELQGACKTGLSCIHTAFMLRETVATSMEESGQCFVAFFDVAKAFDTVWIDGLFKQIYDLGITGKTWRVLYRCYIDFSCRVRVGTNLSEPYGLHCGIHQGDIYRCSNTPFSLIPFLLVCETQIYALKSMRRPVHPWGMRTIWRHAVSPRERWMSSWRPYTTTGVDGAMILTHGKVVYLCMAKIGECTSLTRQIDHLC